VKPRKIGREGWPQKVEKDADSLHAPRIREHLAAAKASWSHIAGVEDKILAEAV
jgi:hypothetical protein